MLNLHPNILTKNGINEFVVLPYEEFIQVQEKLQDFEDLMDLREAKLQEKNIPSLSFIDAKKQLGLEL